MDIELARTFLEIVRTGSFMAAAERLHITQTTVTARIQNLESQLGCRLFIRNRSGATLTNHGERFAGRASQLVQTWDAARRELPLPEDTGDTLVLGAETSLWNPMLLDWLSLLNAGASNIAVRVDVSEPRTLHEALEQGVMDLALVHQPNYWPGMQVEQLMDEKLILVRTPGEQGEYVYVDWGAHFRRQHDAAYPERAGRRLSFNLGPLAIQYLLRNGGSGYFRTRVARRYLQQGLLERVEDSPEFSYPAYLVYARTLDAPMVLKAVELLRRIVSNVSPPDVWN
ncbi:LysR family transcriptional regulator [Marinobacter nanhaiticus D15-8W]|uniref:LysR family transcriptional regulator n=1 Tax=Marinobacter nanhaiticus D15-8W TaxID=626887 RepID=N6WAJ4_9GAMM|nr:LysR family transcriptional regulator [Marinobacter nanhaiticus]ENO17234.1 LysR family transcriptional regulator [Marinobacter nanhaiticus D15-8W]BES72100.1 LysR family transcriptional regulator [Marinobacter nanhaiticus D15-8W]